MAAVRDAAKSSASAKVVSVTGTFTREFEALEFAPYFGWGLYLGGDVTTALTMQIR